MGSIYGNYDLSIAYFAVSLSLIPLFVFRKIGFKTKLNVSTSFKQFYKLIFAEINIVKKRIYDKETLISFQATIISLVLVSYIVVPILINLLPTEYSISGMKYMDFINKYKGYLPYIVYFMYSMILVAPMFSYIIGKISPKIIKRTFIKFLFELLLLFLITIMILPTIIAMTIIFSLLTIAVGDMIFGVEYILIIGFFTFPNLAAYFYSFIATIFLILFKGNILKLENMEKTQD
ncbi:hypothetical protein KAU32_10430 [bacterium]|nr:hypothetical protein [bacterium]